MKTKTLCHAYLNFKRRTRAFSLVEVVIAIGVFSFCLLTLLTLIPVGLTDNKTSRDRMIVADLCSNLESDLRSTGTGTNYSPIYSIKFPTPSTSAQVSTTNTLYDTYLSSSTVTFSTVKSASSQYRFTVVLTSDPTGPYPYNPVAASVQATWPASVSPSLANGTVNTRVMINRF